MPRGENRLGLLLTELRDEVVGRLDGAGDDEPFLPVLPVPIKNFRLLGEEIGIVHAV